MSEEKRILLIEDNDHIRNDLAEILEIEGFGVACADNGETGLALLLAEEGRFDLVVCDYNLPAMTGHDVLKQARGQDMSANLPFILISGGLPPDDDDLPDDRVVFLRKPIHLTTFLDTIRELL